MEGSLNPTMRTRLMLVGAGLAVAVVLAACSDSDDPVSTAAVEQALPNDSHSDAPECVDDCAGGRHPRMHHIALWTGEVLVIHGGSDTWEATLHRTDTSGYEPSTNTWSQRTRAPLALEGDPELRWVWTGRELVIAGQNPDGSGIAMQAYEPRGDTWRILPDFPQPTAVLHDIVWTGGDLFVLVGGVDEPPGMWGIDLALATQWRVVTPPPVQSLHGARGVRVQNDALFVGRGVANPGIRYQPKIDEWIVLEGEPLRGTGQHRLLAVGTTIVSVPGADVAIGPFARHVQVLDLAAGWSDAGAWPSPANEEVAYGVWDERLVIWGGYARTATASGHDGGVTSVGAVWEPSSGQWTLLPQPPLAGACGAAISWTGRFLVVVGGSPSCGFEGAHPTAAAAAYNSLSDAWTFLE